MMQTSRVLDILHGRQACHQSPSCPWKGRLKGKGCKAIAQRVAEVAARLPDWPQASDVVQAIAMGDVIKLLPCEVSCPYQYGCRAWKHTVTVQGYVSHKAYIL